MIRGLWEVRGWSREVFTDASYRSFNDGIHSAAAGVILLKSGNTAVTVAWYTNKIKRVCGSTLEVGSLALVEGLCQAVYVKQVIEEMCRLP